MQRFLQLVSIAIVLTLSRGWELFSNNEFWLRNRNIARHVACKRDVTLSVHAMFKNALQCSGNLCKK